MEQFGRLDGAANVAGVIGKNHSVGALADMEDDEWERIIGEGVCTVFGLSCEVLRKRVRL